MYRKCVWSQKLTVFRHIIYGKCFLKMCQKYVWSRDLTFFWHIFMANVSWECFRIWKDMCQKSVSWFTYDRFQTVFSGKVWEFSDTFLTSDTFLILLQIRLDTFLTEFWIWQISDTYLTHFRQFSDSFLQLTDFWHFSYTFLTDFWKLGDPHSLRVPINQAICRCHLWLLPLPDCQSTFLHKVNLMGGGLSLTSSRLFFAWVYLFGGCLSIKLTLLPDVKVDWLPMRFPKFLF